MPLLFRRLHEKFDQIDSTIERNTRALERYAGGPEDARPLGRGPDAGVLSSKRGDKREG